MISADFPAYLLDINEFEPLEELPAVFRQGKNIMMNHKATGKVITARFFKDGFSDFNEQYLFLTEIWIQMRLRHPCIQRFRGYTLLRDDYEGTAALIYDYTNKGNLQDLIDKSQDEENEFEITPTQKSKIIFGIAYGMQYVHSLSVLHRNLKPSKILLNDQYEPLISDFSLSLFIKSQNELKEGEEDYVTVKESVGTPSWKSPEMVDNRNTEDGLYHLSLKSDVFQFGQIIKYLLTNQAPQYSELDLENWESEFNKELDIYNEMGNIGQLLNATTDALPANRCSFAEIVSFYKSDESFPLFPGANQEEVKEYIRKLNPKFFD
ncbi:hypothetical protein TRFO_39441 [Tritrichomonas foetus]|uniref:Protein kinase domain-containing protein n=1 Tax=Tritrichomonas foetus TaxID=1144522 RepID=A0A1J4J6V0_9EUKA|nr:hypothetical protein TRFO_39441 [Tritrichomonas foetus]|eukprot:OHS94377.1 hypothetical protein TRFO_39441 [Tritrichomonas foetus]